MHTHCVQAAGGHSAENASTNCGGAASSMRTNEAIIRSFPGRVLTVTVLSKNKRSISFDSTVPASPPMKRACAPSRSTSSSAVHTTAWTPAALELEENLANAASHPAQGPAVEQALIFDKPAPQRGETPEATVA